jgi:hypothetical protein
LKILLFRYFQRSLIKTPAIPAFFDILFTIPK